MTGIHTTLASVAIISSHKRCFTGFEVTLCGGAE